MRPDRWFPLQVVIQGRVIRMNSSGGLFVLAVAISLASLLVAVGAFAAAKQSGKKRRPQAPQHLPVRSH
jgi:hypothetical protein